MIFILIFLFIIFILEIIIFGLILSSITITIDNLKAETQNNRIYVDGMIVRLDVKLYRIIKILSVKFYMHYFKVFGIKIYYQKALKYDSRKQLGKKFLEFLKKNKIYIVRDVKKLGFLFVCFLFKKSSWPGHAAS